MSDGADHELAEAWRTATDVDVTRALSELADYPAHVQAFIQQEATRRGVNAEFAVAKLELPESHLLRSLRLGAKLLWRHRFLSAVICGFVMHAAIIQFAYCSLRVLPRSWLRPPAISVLSFIIIIVGFCAIIGCMVILSRPLRSYRRVLGVIMAFAIGSIAYTASDLRPVWDAILALAHAPSPRQFPYPYRVVGWNIFPWAVDLTVVWAIVFIRNRYWPDYGLGKCKKCGYDLRGLPNPRCPECGKTFDIVALSEDTGALLAEGQTHAVPESKE